MWIRGWGKRFIVSVLAAGWVFIFSGVAQAIPVGFVSFNQFIPPDPRLIFPGVIDFSVSNLTGIAFALPPDFPVGDSLTFAGSALSVALEGGTSQVESLGDLGPGDLSGSLSPDTINVTSATFTATLNQTSFLLSDGSTFVALSPALSATILPSSGPFLSAGDFAVLDVAPIPEPGTLVLMGSGLAGLWAWSRRKAKPS